MRIDTGFVTFAYDRKAGRFSLSNNACPSAGLIGARAGLAWKLLNGKAGWTAAMTSQCSIEESPFEDVHGRGVEVRFIEPVQALRLTQTWRFYETRPFPAVRLSVHHLGGESVYLDSFVLMEAGHSGGRLDLPGAAPRFFKAGWHDWVYSGLRRTDEKDVCTRLGHFIGKMLFNPALPIGKGRGDFWSDGFGILAADRTAMLAGFLSTADQFGVLHAACRAGRNAIALIAQADGIPLAPGEQFDSEWGFVRFFNLPEDDPLAEYFSALGRQMNARIPPSPPPLKWTHWYHYFQNINEDLFLENLKEIKRSRLRLSFQTVQLDDGYQAAWGDWETCNQKFPHGLGALADQIKAAGFTPGLWLAPFVVDPRSKIARDHPNWLVKDGNGRPIQSGYFYQFFGHALDTSHPGVQDHIQGLMEKIHREWGFGFVKTDFLYAGGLPGVRYNPHLTRAQALRQGLERIRSGLEEETFLLGCGCPAGPAIGIVDAMRIGPDTGPSWCPFLWNIPWARGLIKEERSIACLRNNLRHTLNWSSAHRRLWWNDPDCQMVRNYDTRLNEAEVKSSLTLTGLSGGQLIVSDDLRRLEGERRRWLSLLTPILSPGGTALDLLEREMPELYVTRMSAAWGEWTLAAVFNWEDRPQARSLDLIGLGYPPEQDLHIFDFWQALYRRGRNIVDLGVLPAHGCRLLRLALVGEGASLVGSTLHITQGGEVLEWILNGEGLHVRLRDLGRQAEGGLYFHLPQLPPAAFVDGRAVNLAACGQDCYRLDWQDAGR